MTPRRLDPGKPIPWIRLFVLLACVFVLKIVAVVQLKDLPPLQPDAGLDTTAYVDLANRVLAGDLALGPGLYYVSPLYIYALAAGLAILHSYTAVRIAQVALGTIAVGFIFLMAHDWFGRRAAWCAAGLAALTGLFTFYESLILQSSIDVFLTSAALYALTKALRGNNAAMLICGLIFGVQTLNRPNVLLAALGVAMVMFAVLRRRAPAVLLVAGLAAGMAPVAIRNVVVSHQWTFVSSHGGLNFYIGNNARATGFYVAVPGVTANIAGQQTDVRRVAARALGRPVTDAEGSDYFFSLARAWVAQHPARALALFARKLAFVFASAHLPLPDSYPFYAHDARTALRFYVVGAWLLVPLGLTGLLFFAPPFRTRAFAVWASFIPAYAAAVAVFFVAGRYRLPVLVPLAVCAGATIDGALAAIAAHRVRGLAMPVAALAALAVAVNWPQHLDDGRWIEGLRFAQQLAIHHRYDEADRWAARLDETGPPYPGAGRYGLGEQLLASNDPARALPYLEAAHRADPDEARVDYTLGRALLKMGRAADALPHLRHGFDAGIELPGGGIDLARALQAAGDFPHAAATIARITPSDPDDPEAWLGLARLAAEVHAPDVAEPLFRRAVAAGPNLAAAHQQYGLDLLVLGRFEAAARELDAAVGLDPRDPDSLSHLAYCEAKLGRPADARAHALAALAVDPSDQLARQLLGILR